MCTKVTYIFVGLMVCVMAEVMDQSQSGDLNVQVNLKNVEIVALLGGSREQYTDYDYNYDYAEMTIKPPGNTTAAAATDDTSSINSSQADLMETTTQTVVEITPKKDPPLSLVEVSSTEAVSSSLPDHGATQLPVTLENAPNTSVEGSNTIAPLPAEAATVGIRIVESNLNSPTVGVVPQKIKECRRGFHRNRNGECELKIKPGSTNALLKLVELSQRLKLRRAN